MTSPTPSAQAPIVDTQGIATQAWARFFASLGSSASPPAAVSVTGTSPLTFVAPRPGVLTISGGAVSAVTMTRGRVSLSLAATAAVLPLGKDDQVKVTFTGASTMTFLPS